MVRWKIKKDMVRQWNVWVEINHPFYRRFQLHSGITDHLEVNEIQNKLMDFCLIPPHSETNMFYNKTEYLYSLIYEDLINEKMAIK